MKKIALTFSNLMDLLARKKPEQQQYRCDCGKEQVGLADPPQPIKCTCGQPMVKLVCLPPIA